MGNAAVPWKLISSLSPSLISALQDILVSWDTDANELKSSSGLSWDHTNMLLPGVHAPQLFEGGGRGHNSKPNNAHSFPSLPMAGSFEGMLGVVVLLPPFIISHAGPVSSLHFWGWGVGGGMGRTEGGARLVAGYRSSSSHLSSLGIQVRDKGCFNKATAFPLPSKGLPEGGCAVTVSVTLCLWEKKSRESCFHLAHYLQSSLKSVSDLADKQMSVLLSFLEICRGPAPVCGPPLWADLHWGLFAPRVPCTSLSRRCMLQKTYGWGVCHSGVLLPPRPACLAFRGHLVDQSVQQEAGLCWPRFWSSTFFLFLTPIFHLQPKDIFYSGLPLLVWLSHREGNVCHSLE